MFNNRFIRKYLQLILIIIFLILTYGMYFVLELSKERPVIGGKAKQDIVVTPTQLKSVVQPLILTYPANVQFKNTSLITPRTEGQVIWMHPDLLSGGSFKKNQILFKLNNPDNHAALKAQKARLDREKASLNLVLAQSKSASAQWKLINPALKVPDLIVKKPEIQQIKANIKEVNANIANLQKQIYFQDFRMPFSGVIETVDIAVGTTLVRNQSYGKAYKIQDLELGIKIPQSELTKINIQDFTAEFNIGDRIFKGSLDRLAGNIDPTTRMQTIIITPEKQALPFLRSGMFLKVSLISKQGYHLYKVKDDILEEQRFLRIINKDHIIEKSEVNILSRDQDFIYVESNGQDINIVKGNVVGIYNGLKVKLINE